MSSARVKFLAMSRVDFKMRVSSVEFEYFGMSDVDQFLAEVMDVGLKKIGNVGWRKIPLYGTYYFVNCIMHSD